jgi:16S rRNA (cytosine967-C5)-methyltransferase
VEIADAASRRPEGPVFDRVLVDPPCSGLGTLQARADLRWRVTPESVREMAAEQAKILAAGAGALRPGGVLVYSTCTICQAENERLIAAFLESQPDFSIDDLAAERGRFAAARSRAAGVQANEISQRCLLTLPDRDRTAGFFIARLRRS